MGVQITSGNIKYLFTQLVAPSGEGEVEGSLWYNTTLNELYTYDGSAWNVVASAPSQTDGHITLMPTAFTVIAGTWGIDGNADWLYYTRIGNGPGAQNDEINSQITLAEGTYTFRVNANRDTSQGIMTLFIDGVNIGTLDYYGAADKNFSQELTSVVIGSGAGGLKTFKIKILTKNGSASNWGCMLHVVDIFRTA